jgi:hypothetical protein
MMNLPEIRATTSSRAYVSYNYQKLLGIVICNKQFFASLRAISCTGNQIHSMNVPALYKQRLLAVFVLYRIYTAIVRSW